MTLVERLRVAQKYGTDRGDTDLTMLCRLAADAIEEDAARIAALEGALRRVNAIRNSIVGYQNVNWSAHIYPLVEALDDVGFTGLGHEKAAALAKTTVGLPYEKMLALFEAAATDAQNTAFSPEPVKEKTT